MIGLQGQLIPLPLLKQLAECELQQREDADLALHLKEQVSHQVTLTGEANLGQSRRLLNHCTQVFDIHGQDEVLLLLNEPEQSWIACRPVIEIRAQGQKHEQGATGFGDGLNEKIDEVLALLFDQRLREELLALIHVEEDAFPLASGKSAGQQVQAAHRVIFQVIAERFQALLREVLRKRKREGLKRVRAWNDGVQVGP